MSYYMFTNPEDAYQSAIRRIARAHEQMATGLDLSGLGLQRVPTILGQLQRLEYLNLGSNHLTTLPLEIGKLDKLKTLNLCHNRLKAVPSIISQLKGLSKLFLHKNNLESVSLEITKLTKLKTLWLHDNPKLSIPPEIVNQKVNPQAILDYLKQKQLENSRPLNEAKLIIVGQGGVGKTSLVKRLLNLGFDESENKTEGIKIEKWSVLVNRPQQGFVNIALNIWDFGGQEIMHSTHQFFLTQRSLYLLVIDARQGEDEVRIEYWLALISNFAPGSPVFIVINKSDQHDLDINRRGLQEKYPAIKGFIRTSARNGNGIEELKLKISSILSEMEHVDSPFPESWMQIKEKLTSMQEKYDYIPYDSYQRICKERGVDEENSQQVLIRFLHDLGIVLNFDDDRIHDTKVLNPNWITSGIYTLLNNPILKRKQGFLRYKQLKEILPTDAFPNATQRSFLREMMLKFELGIELPDRQWMLIPDLISKEQPEFEWNDKESLKFAYQYEVLPHSIFHRFMVRQHHRIDPKIRWRTGAMLYHENYSALVKADIKNSTINIGINGDGDRRQFLYSLRLVFASIHEAISGVKPREVVPIPEYPFAMPVDYLFLVNLEKNGKETLDYPTQDGMPIELNVKELLNGISTSTMRKAGLPTRNEIFNMLDKRFNQDEFFSLIYKLGVNKNEIGGESTKGKMREFVAYMERQNRMVELVTAVRQKRPNLDL